MILNFIKWLLKNRSKRFELGTGHVTRYTILEIRCLFSVYIHEISTQCQDRFHTHAFGAIGWTFKGGYVEEQKDGIGPGHPTRIVKIKGIRRIPRLMNHKLLRALPNTHTLLITGRYHHLWTEEGDDWIKLITKHQTELIKIKI